MMSNISRSIAGGWGHWNNSIESATKKIVTTISPFLPDCVQKPLEKHLLTQSQLLIHSLAITLLFHTVALPLLSSPITWGVAGVCVLITSGPLLSGLRKHMKQISGFPEIDYNAALITPIAISILISCGIYFLGIGGATTIAITMLATTAFIHSRLILIHNNIKEEEVATLLRIEILKKQIIDLEAKIHRFDTFIEFNPKLWDEWREVTKDSSLYLLDTSPLEDLETFNLESQLRLKKARLVHRLELRMTYIRLGTQHLFELFVECFENEQQSTRLLRIEDIAS